MELSNKNYAKYLMNKLIDTPLWIFFLKFFNAALVRSCHKHHWAREIHENLRKNNKIAWR